MLNNVLNYIEENRIFSSGDSVVLGVSGGADSVCLLTVLHELSEKLNLKLYAVHINHCLRGAEADADMEYVKKLCGELGVECFTYKEDIAALADSMKCSAEEAGRYYRYKKFGETADMVGADKIAVAHNMNDNSETTLLNLFRGTGIKGMCGIPRERGRIVRPLLCVSRDEIEAFLDERNIAYRTDSTNLTDEYTRNKIRRNILPYVTEQVNANAVENISRMTEQFREIEDFLICETDRAYDGVISYELNNNNEPSGIYLAKEAWRNIHPAIRKRIIRKCVFDLAGRLKDVTETHIDLVMGLWNLETAKRVSLPYNLYAEKTYDGIKLEKKFDTFTADNADADVCVDISLDVFKGGERGTDNQRTYDEPVCVKTARGEFEISYENPEKIREVSDRDESGCAKIPNLLYTKWFDCDKIKGSLQIRTRRTGDFIVIDDEGSKKKLKSFFIDMKIPKVMRDSVILVADGSHVLWVVGYRMSAAVKVNGETQNCIKIQYKGDNDGR